jgi:DNA-binding transcriptional LysR family regulator
VNFSQLKFVKATSEFSSFSKAAQFCHVTQPTLSNGVSKLEDELGEKIFVRTTRTVGLTAFGEMLLPTIGSILNLEEMIHLNAREFSNPDTVVLKVGMSPLVSTKFVTLLTESYKAQHSKHEVLLIEENLSVLNERLKSQDLDLILVPIIKRSSGKNAMRLYDEDLFFIDKTDSTRSKVPINEIRDKTFVMVPDSCGLSEITRSLLRTTRKEIKEYEGNALSYQVLADWASHGLGSAILPKSKIPPHVSKQQIYRSNKPVKIVFEARWLSNENKQLKKMVQHFRKHMDEIVRGMAD